VLSALGLPPDSISSFVLEMDPVPRALLSVDPTFQAIAVSVMVVLFVNLLWSVARLLFDGKL
jgi:hypothetical protein